MAPDAADLTDLLLRSYRYALALCHDETAAEDLLQEACAAVLKAGGPWNEPYLMRCIRSRFTDLLRRRRPASADGLEEVAGPAAEGRTLEECRGEAMLLQEALGRLRPQEREALFLHVVAGCSAAQAAGIMGANRSTVLTLMQRGRNKLQAMLSTRTEVCR